MSVLLNRENYKKLIDEDIKWLLEQPKTLERDHIVQILSWVIEYEREYLKPLSGLYYKE